MSYFVFIKNYGSKVFNYWDDHGTLKGAERQCSNIITSPGITATTIIQAKSFTEALRIIEKRNKEELASS